MDLTPTIRLFAGRPKEIAPANVYFTFASGRFAYDCGECNAKCCRGHGFLATPDFVKAMTRCRPTLPLFTMPAEQGAQQHIISNGAPGCFFLAADGRCDVHREAGYAQKPETCRLFPFNNLRRLGAYLIVAPHQQLCPLAIADQQSACSDYEALLKNMASAGVWATISESVTTESVHSVIELERAIVDGSERFLDADHMTFVRYQLDVTEKILGGGEMRSALDATLQFAKEGLRLDGVQGRRQVARVATACTPYVRSNFLLPVAGPDGRLDVPLETRRIPLAMAFLYLMLEAAMDAGMSEITFQTVAKLEQESRALALIAANAEAVVAWQEGAPVVPSGFHDGDSRLRFTRIARQLLPSVQERKRRPLAEIVLEQLPSDRLSASLFLRQFASIVAGKVTPLDNPSAMSAVPLRQHVRARIDRLVLAHAPDDLVQSYYDRLYPTECGAG